MLDQVKVGGKVRFAADRVNEAVMIVAARNRSQNRRCCRRATIMSRCGDGWHKDLEAPGRREKPGLRHFAHRPAAIK